MDEETAATDLLAAMKALLRARRHGTDTDLAEAETDAFAAIAKAEGRGDA